MDAPIKGFFFFHQINEKLFKNLRLDSIPYKLFFSLLLLLLFDYSVIINV